MIALPENNPAAAPRSVLLFTPNGPWDQYAEILAELHARYGTRFTVMVPHRNRAHEVRAWGEMVDEIVATNQLEESFGTKSRDVPEARIYERSLAIEDDYGINYLRDYVLTNRAMATRILGMADNSPIAYLDVPPLHESYALINEMFGYLVELFDSKKFDLVVGRPEGFFENTAIYIARARDVPVTFPLFARLGDRFMWASTPFIGHSFLKRKYDRIPKPDMALIEDTSPPPVTMRNRANALKLRSFRQLARKIAVELVVRSIMLAESLRQRTRSKRLSLYRVIARDIASWRLFRYLDRTSVRDIEDATRRPFVLFLLQVEPEWTTLTQAKNFNNTLALIQQLSSKLPAGYRLVVKEHITNVGNRRRDFYERILRIPTVVFAHYEIPGIDLLKRCSAVATISGTIGMEAALVGRRALVFSENAEYVFMPNVRLVTDLINIEPTLREVVRAQDESEIAGYKIGAARYRQAVIEASWDAPDSVVFGGRGGLSPKSTERAADLLVELIAHQRQLFIETTASEARESS